MIKLLKFDSVFPSPRPRPSIKLFMRQTKLGELGLWKVWCSSARVWIIQHKQTDRTSEDRLWGKHWSSHATYQTDWFKKLHENVYLASFRKNFKEKLLFGLIQLIGSTHLKFDVWRNRQSKLHLGQLESTLLF